MSPLRADRHSTVRPGIGLLALGLLLLALPAPAAAWWNNTWGLRRKITFNNSGQAQNLVSFPVLIRLDATRVEYFRTQNLGQDIRFVDADDTTVLAHEIESWNEAGSSFVWVRVPQIDGASTADHIWMYYDNAAAPDGQNVAGVWEPGYRGVWHLKEDPTGAPPQMRDSTSNLNHGTVAFTPVQTPGQINGSLAMDAVAEHSVDAPNAASLQLATNMTVSGWVRTTSADAQARLIVAKWQGVGNNNYWLGKLDAAVMAFGVDGGPNANCPLAFVNDGSWHHVVGVADAAGGRLRIYVDGVERGNSPYGGTSQTGTSPVGMGHSPDIPLQRWIGGIDEVRVENVARSVDWIRAQHLSTRDTFATFEPALCVGTCNPLTVTEGASPQTFTVTSANSFEARFNVTTGGGLDVFYDLAADPGRVNDLAGGTGAGQSLHANGVEVGGIFYNVCQNNQGARLDLLEATATRVRVRQEAFYQQDPGTALLAGLKAVGDYSIYPAGRLAQRWHQRATSPVPYTIQDLDINVHLQGVAPLNSWAPYSQTAGALPNPGPDDFLLIQNEVAGARTDFLDILSKDWCTSPPGAPCTQANGYLAQADSTDWFPIPANEWGNAFWEENTGAVIPAGTGPYSEQPGETWNFLTYFKPTIFTTDADPAVTSRSADYRVPDSLSTLVGNPWSDASENTSGDHFNEAEAAYALTLDPNPGQGMRFRIDGTTAAPRYHPFFKIRQWRSLAGPASVTLNGVALTAGVHYRADVKPLARGYFAQTLSWHSTLQDANALGSGLDVGTTGGSGGGTTFVAGRYGNGALFDASGEYVSAGSSGSLDFVDAGGAVEFWYQPAYAHTDGVRHILWSNASVDDCFFFEKSTGNALVFTVIVDANVGSNCTIGGTAYSATVGSGAYSWTPGQWVHLKTAWRNTGLNRLEIFVDGVKLGNSGAFNPIGLTHGVTNFGGCPATCPLGGTPVANGIIDEPHIYTSNAASQDRLGYAGLTANATERLADPAKNYPLSLFATGSAVRRGQYLHFGSDSKFRGLNVALAVLGVGTGLDLVWEYWNGTAWTDLESGLGFTDLTSHFTRTGNIYWTGDPFGWAPYSVDGGPDLYYVRAHLALGSYSTTPIEGIIKTDILLLQYCGDITAADQEFAIPAPVPTAVSLQSFSASPADGAVELSWTTASELQNLGFHLHRSLSADGPWTRITSALIPGLGSSATGAGYAWRDPGLANGTTYYYLLEDIETTGKAERHGPVSAVPQAGGSGGGAGGDDGSGGSGEASGGDGSGSGGSGGDGGWSSGRITWGDPSGTSLRVLERGSSHVVLELVTPGFTARTENDGTIRVSIPGFEDTALPGTLDVPVRHALVPALAGRRARLTSVTPGDVVSFDSFRLAAAGTRDLVVRADGTLRTGSSPRRLREVSRRAGLTPRVWARLLGSLFQGETKKARLELSPLRHDPDSGLTLLARRLTVRVEFTGTEPGERSLGGARGRRPPAPALRRRGVMAQLVTRDPGLYRTRFEELFAPGQRGLPARSLRLSRHGRPVAYHLEPEGSLFGPGSSLFFVSEARDPDPRGESVFELSFGQTASFMEMASGAPSGPSTREYLHTLKLEQNKFYQSSLLLAPDLWLWDLLVSPVTRSYPFTVEGLSPSPTSGRLKVVLQGASDFPELDHHLRLSVNGIPVGEATWDGMTEQVVEVELTAGVLAEGANRLSLESVGDAGAAYSMVFLNRFEVSYPRPLVANAGRMGGHFEEPGRAEVLGLTGPAFVIDTTPSESSPIWLQDLEATPAGVAFRAEAGRSYLAVSEPALLVPEVRKTAASRLRSASNRAQWVLIGPRELLPAASPLVELRRRQGLLPLAVALEDVLAEFGYGEAHPQAIRDFLAFAFHNWTTRPRYVVLLGDTTYDPRNYLGTGVKDRVPSPVIRTTYLWTVSDPTLAAVNGDDLLPDLAIGRLSAGTREEAQRLVQKLVSFEEAGRTFHGTAVLVADNADVAGSFEQNQDEIAQSVLQGREVEKVYLRDLGASTRTTIRSALDSGPGLVSYVGHGATAVWASENVWNNTDLATLGAQAQQPLLLTLNCLNGFFHFPPFDSLAEAFVKAEGKGAIAAFSPSGLSVNDAAHLYHKALLGEIEEGQHPRLGDALLAAQKAYADQGAMPELLSIYHLFGDPGMRIQ